MYTHQGKDRPVARRREAFLATIRHARVRIATGARKELDRAIAAWQTYATDQTGSALAAQGATQQQRALRERCSATHGAIARIAKARLPRTPELAPLRDAAQPPVRPAARHGGPWYGAGGGEAHRRLFVAAGLPEHFLTG